jgi:hypothetical protein
MKAAKAEIERLKLEVHKLKAESDILEDRPRPTSPTNTSDFRVREAPRELAADVNLRGIRYLALELGQEINQR